MSDRISIPVDGWKLEARKLGDGIEIAIVTDDKPPTSHYVRLSAIGSAALLHYLTTALPSRPQLGLRVSEEALRNAGCPSDRRGTVGDCQDAGTCGCSLPLTSPSAPYASIPSQQLPE